ncbi:MAG: CPBP family intramembrane metalloprotease [Gemmatimonadaceae bacterium]|nr:CPBP family intramembrane metalloprotease [Gemmatimonadaceae bacterium]
MNFIGLIFLVALFVLIPRGALRTARLLRQMIEAGVAIPKRRIVLSAMFSMSVLWALAALNASAMGRALFSFAGAGPRDLLVGVAGLALLLAAIPMSRAGQSPDDERRSVVYRVAPQGPRDLAMFTVLALMAGVAEEAAYRGVAVWILAPVFGNALPAILLSAAAFAVAHAVQGGRAIAIVFAIALLFHALVQITGTLVIAMAVHAAYDIVAGVAAGRRARTLLARDAAPVREASHEGGAAG